MLENLQVFLFFLVDFIGVESDDFSVCQSINRIFDKKLTVVNHFIENLNPTFGFAKCVENYPGNPTASYSFQVSPSPGFAYY